MNKNSYKKGALLSALLLSAAALAACGEGKSSESSMPAGSSSESVSSEAISSSESLSSQGRISSDWDTVPANTNSNLKYFTFYHPDGFVSEPSMLEQIHDLDLANFFLLNGGASTEVVLQRLAYTKSIGYHCTIGITGSIFESSATETLGIGKLKSLKQNWKDIFHSYADPFQDYIDDGTIYAFYIDEPAWNGCPEDVFVEVTKWLSEEYPNTGRMACFTTMEVGIGADKRMPELSSTYFDYLTDVSYDLYADWSDELRLQYLEQLKTKLTKDQWIWGTPRTFTDNPEAIHNLVDHMKGIYTEAIQEPRYRGIACFSWSNGFDGDWDYGAKSFLLEDSEYYSRELHELYSNVGRSVIGKELLDWTQIPTLSLVPPSEVYYIGDDVSFPMFGALDGLGGDIDVTLTLTSPTGKNIDTSNGEFVPEESGNYTFTIAVGEGDYHKEKSCAISVRYGDEISRFENVSYTLDAFGNDDSFWCWPREVVTDFSHTGTGSLKVNPHPTDGTWPAIQFARDGNLLWDISETKEVSMWIYNPSNDPLESFGFIFQDEYQFKSNDVYVTADIPAKEWFNLKADVNEIASKNPDLDLTKVIILFGNVAPDYKNRTSFYIDDVELLGEREIPTIEEGVLVGFENANELAALPAPTDDSLWCWPRVISEEQYHGGKHSLKITPHATDGIWPNFDLGNYNLDGASKVSIWVYFDSDNDYDFFGLIFDVNKHTAGNKVLSRTWTEVTVNVADVVSKVANPTDVNIKFGNIGPDYADRSVLYIDSFNIEGGNPLIPPTTNESIRNTLMSGAGTDVRQLCAADSSIGYTVMKDSSEAGLFPSGQNGLCGLDNGASPACSKINFIDANCQEVVVKYVMPVTGYFYNKLTIMPWQNVSEGTFRMGLYVGESDTPISEVEFTSLTQDSPVDWEYAGYFAKDTELWFSIEWERETATGNFGLNMFKVNTFEANQLPLPKGFNTFNDFCFFDKSEESLKNFIAATAKQDGPRFVDKLSCYYHDSKNGSNEPNGSNDWCGYDAGGNKFNIKDNGSAGCTKFAYDFTATENGYMYVKFGLMPWQDATYTINIKVNGVVTESFASISAKTNVQLNYEAFEFVNAGDVLTYEVVCESVSSSMISLAVNDAYYGFYACPKAL